MARSRIAGLKETEYEVWVDAQGEKEARSITTFGLPKAQAKAVLQSCEEEEKNLARLECRDIRRKYLLVRVTTTREVVEA